MPYSRNNADGVTRRDFLAVGGMSVMGMSVAERLAEARRRGLDGRQSCLLVLLNGGGSQLETFDPKPDAPREIRGPLTSIQTATPGVRFSEPFPRLAERTERLEVLRSLYHDAAPIHETGLQLLQTGGLRGLDSPRESLGSRLARQTGSDAELPTYVIVGGRCTLTGCSASIGDDAGSLGPKFDPLVVLEDGGIQAGHASGVQWQMTDLDQESTTDRRRYGENRIGRMLLQSRQLIEQGIRFVTVNTFSQLEGQRTWDAHGQKPIAPATLFNYQNRFGPQLDRALAALLDDLESSGLLSTTLVVCTGEFGRAPHVNEQVGRDHWTRVWSGIVAGGNSSPGQVVGDSDAWGAEIHDSPIHLADLSLRIGRHLGLDDLAESLHGDAKSDSFPSALPQGKA